MKVNIVKEFGTANKDAVAEDIEGKLIRIGPLTISETGAGHMIELAYGYVIEITDRGSLHIVPGEK